MKARLFCFVLLHKDIYWSQFFIFKKPLVLQSDLKFDDNNFSNYNQNHWYVKVRNCPPPKKKNLIGFLFTGSLFRLVWTDLFLLKLAWPLRGVMVCTWFQRYRVKKIWVVLNTDQHEAPKKLLISLNLPSKESIQDKKENLCCYDERNMQRRLPWILHTKK